MPHAVNTTPKPPRKPPVLIYLDFDNARWARYEGKTRTLRGVEVQPEAMRSNQWHDVLGVIRYNPHSLMEPESA